MSDKSECERFGHVWENVAPTWDLAKGKPMVVCAICGEPGWIMDPPKSRLVDG